MHYREMLFQTSLHVSPPLGDTWQARGSSSPMDFFLYQRRGFEVSFEKRQDLRMALPSDHNAIIMTATFRGRASLKRRMRPRRTLCGKWQVSGDALWKDLILIRMSGTTLALRRLSVRQGLALAPALCATEILSMSGSSFAYEKGRRTWMLARPLCRRSISCGCRRARTTKWASYGRHKGATAGQSHI